MIQRKRLSLCMITKNDEEYLFDCLQDFKDVADEVIIVDIGSDDKTIEIAKQAGATVCQMKWGNSFSEAKNICLDHANGRWILFLQANEFVTSGNLKKMKRLLDNPNAEGYLLFSSSQSEQRGITSPAQAMRLFRNRKEYRYRYQSFELIPYEQMANIKDSYIQIEHRDDSRLSWQTPLQILLLQDDITQYPEDSYVLYLYGIELLNQQQLEEGIVYLQKARAILNLGYLFAPHLFKCLSWALLYLEQYSEALAVLDEGICHFYFYTDLFVIRGEVYKQLKQYAQAIQDLESCLEIREQSNLMVPGPEIGLSVILETLGEAHELLLNDQHALECYQQAYELDAANQDLLDKINELTQKPDSIDSIENSIQTAAENPFTGLECVVWSKDLMYKWQEWIHKFHSSVPHEVEVPELVPKISTKPSSALLAFYHCLKISTGNSDEVTQLDSSIEPTCAEIHEEIASLYLNSHKVDLALSAYLRALQWSPQNVRIQERIWQFSNANPSGFNALLEGKKWILEGGWFQHRQAFINYVYGLIQFRNRQFEQACLSFSKISDEETIHSVALAYLISSLWLGEKVPEAENRLDQSKVNTEMIAHLFTIMKNYVLYRLDESQRQYPFSERIQREHERVRNLKYE